MLFDLPPHQKDGWREAEGGFSWCDVGEAPMASAAVVVVLKIADGGFERAGQATVLERDQ